MQWGFIAGILIGVVIGCATFALSASRIDSIKYSFDGSEYRSSLDRSRDDQAVLSAHGGKIQGLNLQSYLFFGSANRLYQHVKALLRASSGVPVPAVRFQAGHRHQFFRRLQFRPDQADRARPRHQTGAGPSSIRGREGAAVERIHHARSQHPA